MPDNTVFKSFLLLLGMVTTGFYTDFCIEALDTTKSFCPYCRYRNNPDVNYQIVNIGIASSANLIGKICG